MRLFIMNRTESFKKINRSSVSDQIFDELKNRIISHEWKPGDKIPTETEIANMFGVSRLSARTAIQRLSALGLIDIRVGDGTYIKEAPLENYLDNGADLLSTIEQLDELSQFRSYLEGAILDVACEVRTDEDIHKMRELLSEMIESAEQNDLEAFHIKDFSFHEELCRITRNRYFMLVFKLFGKGLADHFRESTEKYSHLPNLSDDPTNTNYYLKVLSHEHGNYISALEQQDPSIAMPMLRDYLYQYKVERHNSDK